MKSHIVSVHEKRRPFSCAECGKTFSDKRNMLRHHQSVHEKKKVYKYEVKCPLCKYVGRYKSELVAHMARMHQNTFFDRNEENPNRVRFENVENPSVEDSYVENPSVEHIKMENLNGENPDLENQIT